VLAATGLRRPQVGTEENSASADHAIHGRGEAIALGHEDRDGEAAGVVLALAMASASFDDVGKSTGRVSPQLRSVLSLYLPETQTGDDCAHAVTGHIFTADS